MSLIEDAKVEDKGVSISGYAKVTYSLDADDVAKLFLQLDGEEVAHFFNKVGEEVISKTAMQLQHARDSGCLDEKGERFMGLIGEYAQ